MNTATKFEFDMIAEHDIVNRNRAAATSTAMSTLAAAAFRRTARVNAAHCALMRAVW